MNYFMFFIPYPLGIYNLDYECIKELNIRLYTQCEKFRKACDKLHILRQSVKDLTRDIRKLTSLKYLSKYESAIKKNYDELFITKTLIKEENVKFYIDNLYALSTKAKFSK